MCDRVPQGLTVFCFAAGGHHTTPICGRSQDLRAQGQELGKWFLLSFTTLPPTLSHHHKPSLPRPFPCAHSVPLICWPLPIFRQGLYWTTELAHWLVRLTMYPHR